MKLKVGIVMSRNSGGTYSVTITDEASRILLVEVEMDGEQFAKSMTAHYVSGLDAVTGRLSLIGMTAEHKDERVPFESGSVLWRRWNQVVDTPEALTALAPFEVDGWVGNKSDLYNSHRTETHFGVRCQRVGFTRHVKKKVKP